MDDPLASGRTFDWALCCLCQAKSRKDLRQPYKKECHHPAYDALENDIKTFTENSIPLPLGLSLADLDDGTGIASTLLNNQAKYHNACRSRFRPLMVQRELEKRTRDSDEKATPSPKKTRSSFNAALDRTSRQCVCCQGYEESEKLYRARSANCGRNLHKWATESKNWVVVARLATAVNLDDAEAADIHYHVSCYMSLKNNARAALARDEGEHSSTLSQTFDPLIVAQIVAAMQGSQAVFKLADLRKLYDQKLMQLESDWVGKLVHATRFKDHILEKLGPQWSEYSAGRDVFITRKKTAGAAVAETARLQVTEAEAMKLAEVGVLLRKYILLQQMPFNGSFAPNCLSEPVAKPLLMFLNILLEGSSSVEEQIEQDQASISARVTVACTISQLVCSNAAKQSSSGLSLYQRKERETPFPLYMGLKLHSSGRQKGMINMFHSLGMCVSYDRVMGVRKSLARAVSKRFSEEGAVVPLNLKRGVFTTGGVDNIDESGRVEFHGTAITLTNHPTVDKMGVEPPPLSLDDLGDTTITLPEDFSVVPYIDEYAGDVTLPAMPDGTVQSICSSNPRAAVPEQGWLEHVHKILGEDDGKLSEVPVTYSGFFSHSQDDNVRPRATVGVFPVFYEKASSIAMQKHAMLIVKKATEFVNPGQIPIIEGDCPLYALQKKCQWLFPEEVGESKMVCFIGFLHIEMASQECGGKLLAGSGWERMFHHAKIFTSGVAASLLGGKHIKRTRYAYQLTLAWLHVLEIQAYQEFCRQSSGPHIAFEMWEQRLANSSSTAYYWLTVKMYLLINSQFVRGQRSGDWPLTLSACSSLCPWLFTFGHTNYARWMPVFLRDMAQLPTIHPSVHQEFMSGKFVVQRSERKFSLMALDQSQEHSIQFLKNDGGAKGLYGQQEEKEVIELSKPEVLRVIGEFEANCSSSRSSEASNEHPESAAAEQRKFLNHLKSMLQLVSEGVVINPFKETGLDLVTLDTGEVSDPEVVRSLREAPDMGKAMFKKFVEERIDQCVKPLSDVIKRPNVYTFSNKPPVDLKKGADKTGSVKANSALITKLFMSLQARPDADLDDFFKYENRREPPSLSDKGNLRSGTKSDILRCLPNMPITGRTPAAKEATVVVLDMAAVIHFVKPQRAKVFGEYAQMQLMPYLSSQMTSNTTRVDAVWDTYRETSLKSQTRSKRGQGQRTRVSPKVPLPKGAEWQKFLKDGRNKEDLFQFLSGELQKCASTPDTQFHLFTTKGELVLTNRQIEVSSLSPCQQEEADTRMMLHLYHAAQQGHTKAYLRTVDSDVVVLAINLFQKLGLTQLWIGFGHGKAYKDISIHSVVEMLDPQHIIALPFFHAITGCDVVSSLYGIGKKTAWSAWGAFPQVTETFVALTQDPLSVTLESKHMQNLERWVVLMYCKNSNSNSLNEARKQMFTRGLKDLDSIPPTKHAFFQHIKRTLLCVAFVWNKALLKTPEIPNPGDWGWRWNARTREWVPHWTDLPEVSQACSLLLNCGCTQACRGNCKCWGAQLHCTSLCKCGGGCTNSDNTV